MKKFLLFFLVFFLNNAYSQSNISARFFFVSTNFTLDKNNILYKTNIIPEGFLTFEPGINLSAEFFQDEDISLKFMTAFFMDPTTSLSLNLTIMLRFRFYFVLRNYFTIGLGPSFFARNSWERFPNYQNIDKFKTYNNIQYRLWGVSGEFEYCRILTKTTDFCISVNHLHPYSATVCVGLKYWFSRKSRKCNTCPSFH